MRTLRSLMTLALVAAVTTSCVSRNVETISEEEAAAMGSPSAQPSSSDPAAPAAPAVAAPAAAEPGFNVTVSVGAEVATIPAGILYVIVRVAGRAGGPPLAVKRLPAEFPAEFRVTAADSMVPGTPLVPAMDLTVRLDQDGDAMSKQEGDLTGTVGPVAAGDTIEVVLSPADVSPAR